jgi:predicted nucleic acid-binding protein
MIYLDTSAAAKIVHPETESTALAIFLTEHIGRPLVSSALLHLELVRAVTRHRPDLSARATALLRRVMMVPVANDILVGAATIGTPALRALDALHLATAEIIASELDAFVTYDKRLADAATGIGLRVAAPA